MAATALVHLPALNNHLVADSWVFAVPRSLTETLEYFAKTVIPAEWEAYFLRPVPMLFFWLDSQLWPETEWGPHLINIVFHLLNVLLIWLLVRLFQRSADESGKNSAGGLPLFAASLFFGLHPLTVGSVGWVAARFDLICTTFGLAGIYTWLKWSTGKSGPGYLIASPFLLLAGLLSKEQGVVFIAVCILVTLYLLVGAHRNGRKLLLGLFVLAAVSGIYLLYRWAVFGGLGGYLAAPQQGLSIQPPIGYLVAVLFPFLNFLEGWSFSWLLIVVALIVLSLGAYLWREARPTATPVHRVHLLAAAGLFVGGLATTLPQPGMTFDVIMNHGESRYTLVIIAGLSLLIGIAVQAKARTLPVYRAVLIAVIVWSAAAAWRTDVQIQAWKDAGDVAHAILEDTLHHAPDPAPNSQLIFVDLPVHNEQYAYIFGIGLKEALQYKYGRDDITINRYPELKDFKKAKRGIDYVFRYDRYTRRLVLL